MNLDPARDRALNPTTPPAELAEIATHRPDLRVDVAGHPQAYPALLDWLRGLGDPAVVAAVDGRSRAAEMPRTGAPQATHPGASYGSGPGYADPGPAYESQHPAAAAQAGWAPQGAVSEPAQQWGAAPQASIPAAGGFSFAGPSTGTADHGAAAYGSTTFGSEIPVAPRRRKGLVVASAVAGTAVVLGGAAFAVNHFVLDKVNGSPTPAAAFEQLVVGLEKKDALAMLGAMSPAEVASVTSLLDASLAEGESSATGIKAYTDILETLTFTTEGVTTTSTDLQEGLAKVEVTAGTITVDGDPAKIADSLIALMNEMLTQNPELGGLLSGGTGGETFDPQTLRPEMLAQIDAALPATGSFADLAREGQAFFVVTVEENDAWYVSPYMSVGEAIYISSGSTTPRGAMLGDGLGASFDSPVAAADGLVKATLSGKVDQIISALPLPERRVLSVYAPQGETFDATVGVEGTFTETAKKNGRADLTPKGLKITDPDDGNSVTLDGVCLTAHEPATDRSGTFCLDEAPLVRDMGLAGTSLVAVEEDGQWFVSPTETMVAMASDVSTAVQALEKSGRLNDPAWMESQVKALSEYLATQPLFADAASGLSEQLSQGGGLGMLGGLPGLGMPGMGLPGLDLGAGAFGSELSGLGDAGGDLSDLGADLGDLGADLGQGSENDLEAPVSLVQDLASARIAVETYLVDARTDEPSIADSGASILAEGGYVASPEVTVMIVALDAAEATYCIAALDNLGANAPESMDQDGARYESLTCS